MSESFPLCGRHPVIDDPSINITYDAVLAMSHAEFLAYIERMRAYLLRVWDESGIPPTTGWSQEDVEDDFAKLLSFPASKMWRTDQVTGMRCIHNTQTIGNSVNAFNIGRMLKVRINYTEKDDGKSIYDFFAKPALFKRYLPYARRHFLRDSFYFFAQSVKRGDALPERPWIKAENALQYVRDFAEHTRPYHRHELLLEAKKHTNSYSGYAEHLRTATFLALTFEEVQACVKDKTLPSSVLRVIKPAELNDQHVFHVRLYEKGKKLFPAMFKSFRISMCSFAHQYPPLTAKLIYEDYLGRVPGDHPLRIWDPSAGWGGRMLGALSVNLKTTTGDHREVEYIGTDPNPDFYENGTSVYAVIGDLYNRIRSRDSLFGDVNTHQVFPCGSEVFHEHEAYCARKGTFDVVFTSPPYFNREAYSEDQNQSYKKFGAYESWRDTFLAQTLKNAWDALAPGRYLLWNIADIKVGKKYLPLEQDSIDICERLGFVYDSRIHMVMSSMPGANRVNADGTLTAKNMSRVNGVLMKHEPIFVFRKPE